MGVQVAFDWFFFKVYNKSFNSLTGVYRQLCQNTAIIGNHNFHFHQSPLINLIRVNKAEYKSTDWIVDLALVGLQPLIAMAISYIRICPRRMIKFTLVKLL